MESIANGHLITSSSFDRLAPPQLAQVEMEEKSKILVIGCTGRLGKYLVEASASSGHPTFALVRQTTAAGPAKAKHIHHLQEYSGVTLLYGEIDDHQSLVKAIKQVDVVISAVGSALLGDQTKIIAAIKDAGNVKRFFPSEFGMDVDRIQAIEPSKCMFDAKADIRRTVEREGVPYTLVCNNFLMEYFLPGFFQLGATQPPRDKVNIIGDGTPKTIFVHEQDVASYTIKAADDPRTLNKILYITPPPNIYSFNELVSLWERKIGKELERIYIPKEQFLERLEEAADLYSILYIPFVNGDQTNFEKDESASVEATHLYPEARYTTVDEYLNRFI